MRKRTLELPLSILLGFEAKGNNFLAEMLGFRGCSLGARSHQATQASQKARITEITMGSNIMV